MRSINILVVQNHIVMSERNLNIQKIDELLTQAFKENHVDLICFPQCFLTGANWSDLHKQAEDDDGQIVAWLKKTAKQNDTWVSAGLLEQDKDQIFDSNILINSSAQVVHKHRRCILLEDEEGLFSRGNGFQAFDTEFGKVGLLVGYEVNFILPFLEYFKQQVDLILICACIPNQYSYSVDLQCRAFSATTHSCIVYANGVGENVFANIIFGGQSSIYCDPLFLEQQNHLRRKDKMEVLAALGSRPDFSLASVDLGELHRAKKRVPHFSDFNSYLTTQAAFCE
ncbi:MAG: carbon-nitrogen hydrolase family protein [Thermoleophilia bacterium]